jgi:hypothetical protein
MLSFHDEVVARFWTHGETHASCTIRSVEGLTVHQAHISWFPNTMFAGGEDLLRRRGPETPVRHRTARPALSYAEDRQKETSHRTQLRFESQDAYDRARRDADDLWNTVANLQYAHSRTEFASDYLLTLEDEIGRNAAKSDAEQTKRLYLKRFVLAIQEALGDPTMNTRPVYPAIDAIHAYDRERARLAGQKDVEGRVVTGAAEKVCIPGVSTSVEYQHTKGGRLVADASPADIARLTEKFPPMSRALWGLNLHAVLAHWTAFVAKHKHGYQYASTQHNCAGVVLSALKAGGVGAYVSTETGWLGGDSLLFVKPSEVNEIVHSLMVALEGVNRDTREFMEAVARTTTLFNDVALVRGNLWSPREFATASRSPNKLSLRREQIGHIDKSLAAFHKAGAAFTPENFETKLYHLVRMMYYICEHRRLKPASDRRRGVDSLGVQIIHLMSANPIGAMYGHSLAEAIAAANRAAKQRIDETIDRQERRRN